MKNNNSQNVYTQMQRFANLTKTMIIQGNITRAKKCFEVAEKLLTEGSNEVRNAVINVFVYSVASFMEVHRCNIKNLFSGKIAGEYQKQLNANCP